MQDYGKVQSFLFQKGEKIVIPPPQPPKAPGVWDKASNGRAWDAAMAYIGFSDADGENPRWIYTFSPRDNRLGITIIVYFTNGQWLYDFCIDTLATEDDADWHMGIEALDHGMTPLQVAKEAKEHVQELLEMALKALLSEK